MINAAFPVCVNSDLVKDGVTGFHAVDASEWFEKLGILINNSELRNEMAKAAAARVQAFDKKVIGGYLVKLIKQFLTAPCCTEL